MVVVQALRGVQNVGFVDPQVRFQVREQILEVRVGRLVGPDVLGGVDGVELDAELAVRRGDAVAMHVGQDDECVTPLEDAQGLRGIRERRPVRHRGAEGLVELDARLETEALRDAPVHACEQLRIAQTGRGVLVLILESREGGERRGTGDRRAAVAHDQRLQRVPDSALPVDQGAVAVERQDTKICQSGHGDGNVLEHINGCRP